MLNGKSILITGGTGSFGKNFVRSALQKFPDIKRLVIYSRDELKQFEMQQELSPEKYKCLRYFIGDVRDGARLRRACEGIDIIIHAAALKQVPAAEYNPIECINTNILGAENVINAALDTNVQTVVALSTDKAAAPINLYGATKLCSDKLFVAANNMRGLRNLKFVVVRYGNVLGSRGSVIPFFLEKKKTGVLPITDERMTRFSISLEEANNLVYFVIEKSWGGEVFVPKIPSYNIMDVAKALGPECKFEMVGIRPGEKLHEEMITESDCFNTYEFTNYYVIGPSLPLWKEEDYLRKFQGTKVPFGFKYNSGSNPDFLSIDHIRSLIKKHVEPNL
jgi:UDP-N-acetylglucosamine 4,6-dehydratase (inverting)